MAAAGAALEQALCAAAADLKQAGAKYDPYVLKPSGRDAQVSTWIAAQNGTVPGYAEVLDFSNSAKKSRESLLLDVFHPGPYVKATAPIEGEGRPCRRRRCCGRSPSWWMGPPSGCCCTSATGAAASWPGAAAAAAVWDSASCSRAWIPGRTAARAP